MKLQNSVKLQYMQYFPNTLYIQFSIVWKKDCRGYYAFKVSFLAVYFGWIGNVSSRLIRDQIFAKVLYLHSMKRPF